MKGSGSSFDHTPQVDQACCTALAGMIIGRSPAMQEVARMIRQVAVYPTTTVLLQGESGTGKDVAARAIHELSNRATFQFIDINCAALPDTLLETELFGVEAGAYTDAKALREGYLLRADGGTLFLDEIGSMPLALQAKLLRFLETRSFRRVGGIKELHVDIRVISATNVDLQAAVARRVFRDDLFYRLKVITIYLPPLRERPEDIDPLVEHFLQICGNEGLGPLHINEEALELLRHYHWPGNVRELRNVIQRGQILCEGHEITPKDLPESIQRTCTRAQQRLQELQQQMHLPTEGVDLLDFLCTIERTFIREALELCDGNQVQAAALLRISRDQLRYRLGHLTDKPDES
ncbi:sigma-54-dependent Fis family transcriptional regulator [Ktedonosporobacter rubrisoli]|uniref:Sigma-54-dependent Fis family transcriptional regulator n=1 Tax=Ktedonosporobacter rubrisoli TaxID=2509675 RepID=A0A4P6JST3_KTERU|nr:sigma-54 dependent transcriptional regulator [Ktedonosporobacter rubrisoli]QBD78474.1 sigma-54-dependent Fis family transcriptional regulator [Ktedonosporobacter rubrisoli]